MGAVGSNLSNCEIKTNELAITARPFLKWAGGKNQILPTLAALRPREFNTYYEPFLGGGAFFFHLNPNRAILSDLNPELVNAFQMVQSNCEGLIASLAGHQNTPEYYYQLRQVDPEQLDPTARAARFIFLNKTCYNGLYRVNRSGRFNVPYGRYGNPNYADATLLRRASRVLATAQIRLADFTTVTTTARPGDLVYFDPPYQPLSATANFTSYTSAAFDGASQARLAEVFRELDQRGCYLMLSNSDTPLIHQLYHDFRRERIMAKRQINCRGERRGAISELVIVNY